MLLTSWYFCLFLGQYYPENEEDDGPGISAVVGEHVTNIMIFLFISRTILS